MDVFVIFEFSQTQHEEYNQKLQALVSLIPQFKATILPLKQFGGYPLTLIFTIRFVLGTIQQIFQTFIS